MKRKIQIIPFDEYSGAKFYSFIIDDNEDCEMVLLMKQMIVDRAEKEAQIMSAIIERIGKNGAQERYFRYAGTRRDHVFELPDHFSAKIKYRLYCLRLGEIIVILGNGGVKTTRTYQEDENLNSCVETLKQIDRQISSLINQKLLRIKGKDLIGKLEFYIN